MKLTEIREKVWPLLEPLDNSSPPQIRKENITLTNEENLKTAYDWAVKYYENEDKRSSTVETKSAIFIGTVGFLITILLTISKDLLTISGFNGLVSVMAFSVIIIYLCRVVWFAIKALQRNKYHTIGFKDFIIEDDNYRKQLIVTLINYAKKNEEVVNQKVDYMTMAQEYFKRAIWAIAIYSVLLVIFVLYKNQHNIIKIFSEICRIITMKYVFIAILISLAVLFIFRFNLHKHEIKILKYANKVDINLISFWGKIGICFGFIILVFAFYILISIILLEILESHLYQNADLLKLLGFFAILCVPFAVTIGLYKKLKIIMHELKDYFKLWADFGAVLIPVVIMYKDYYLPETHHVSYSNNLLIMLLSNEGILGIPFVILLIRFIIAFGELKEKEKEKQNLNDIKSETNFHL